MRKILSALFLCMLATLSWAQQTSLRGVVKSETTDQPLPGVTITLGDQNVSTTTNERGEFLLQYIVAGPEELLVTGEGFMPRLSVLTLQEGVVNDLGDITIQEDLQAEMQSDAILQLSEADIEDDEGKGQNTSSSTNAQSDVYNSTINYAWSSVRFRQRGYENIYEDTYINGLNFNSQERGNFNYSMLGGLNDASRNKDVYQGIEANSFAFGGIGQQTNIDMRATSYAQGWKIGLAGTNRNYKMRVNATYASGLLDNGWAFVGSLAYRYSPMFDIKGIIGEGIDYNSLGYFFSAEKRFGSNQNHSIQITTFGSPTQRGQNAAVTQEVYYLTGSINYNPYWGYQNGKPRNSRVVKSFDPTALVAYEWKINENQRLNVAVGYHYSLYSNSAISFFDATDPRPDYYRNLPSFLLDGQLMGIDGTVNSGSMIMRGVNDVPLGDMWTGLDGSLLGPSVDQKNYNDLVSLWQSRDNTTTQINWDALYQANYANNANNPDGVAKYVVERRHNDLQEAMAHILYTNQINEKFKLTVGADAKYSQGLHYKTMDDLLGANQWIDYDPFADRDTKDLAENIGMTQSQIEHVRQNDIDNPDRVIKKGDVFGYNYHINMSKESAFFQNEWKWSKVNFYYAVKLTYSSFQREGLMNNGRASYLAQLAAQDFLKTHEGTFDNVDQYYARLYRSKGVGKLHSFIDPSAKIGVHYSINGRNRLKFNALAETRAPYARDAYMSQRVHDRAISVIETHDNAKNLKDYYAASQKNLAYDLTYEFNFPIVRGRVTAFQAWMMNGAELNGYYDDEARTFVNQAVTGINRLHQGIEAAAAIKLGLYFTLTPAITISDNRYISNAYSVSSAESGMALGEDYRSTLDASGKETGNMVSTPIYELKDSVLIKGLRVATGPQLATSLKLSFFHPKMWFADITISYFDWNYLDYAPSRRMQGLFTGTRADGTKVNGKYETYDSYEKVMENGVAKLDENGQEMTRFVQELDANGHPKVKYPHNLLAQQESLVDPMWYNRFMIDASVGKLIYLPKRQSLSINLSVSNLTNNTHMKTGGYQQARLPRATEQGTTPAVSHITTNAWKFPSKYYYAWGANFFLSVTYKF